MVSTLRNIQILAIYHTKLFEKERSQLTKHQYLKTECKTQQLHNKQQDAALYKIDDALYLRSIRRC